MEDRQKSTESDHDRHSPGVLLSVIRLGNDIVGISDFPQTHKRECMNLIRRVKLVLPFCEEIRDSGASLPETALPPFHILESAFKSGLDLLQLCRHGSKIYLVFESEAIMNRLHSVMEDMISALDQMPWELFDVSEEVQEQAELVHLQLKRAKGRADTQDIELIVDIALVMSQKDDSMLDTAILKRLADKLQLKTSSELAAEASAVQKLVKEKGNGSDGNMEQMSILLGRLKSLTEVGKTDKDVLELEKLSLSSPRSGETPGSPTVPDDFRCPISLELMKDPVIVATGQTYERASIQKWLEGHKTCPKTGQVLSHTVLTPNFVLRSLIAQWCECNGIEAPKRTCSNHNKSAADLSSKDVTRLEMLVQHLSSGDIELQRAAAAEIRSLAKQNSENRISIAEVGAIPQLVALLTTEDSRTQEHAVTALLNLSIHEGNKGAIVRASAIPLIVGVLKHGSMEARENAAATLFSLSVMDENKMTIGASGAIPALVDLLRDGNPRGRKDAATALFNLAIYQGNKPRAIRAGIVEPLMKLLVDPNTGMRDEALAILAILATHQEGRIAIGNASAVPALVDLIQNSSNRNKENAAAILLTLCVTDPRHLIAAQKLGVKGPLIELSQSGTARARRKASSLLEYLNKQEDIMSAQ